MTQTLTKILKRVSVLQNHRFVVIFVADLLRYIYTLYAGNFCSKNLNFATVVQDFIRF